MPHAQCPLALSGAEGMPHAPLCKFRQRSVAIASAKIIKFNIREC
ncbi:MULTISPECIES: hypothetical protein [unclassified Calothrix]|nr:MULTISPECIES: hypothetical protein [unclassified Calothrix]